MGKLPNAAKNIGVIAVVLVIGMAIPSIATSNSLGEQITVCVDWNTKQVTYSKYWERCPAKTTAVQLGTVGPAGPKGEIGESAYDLAVANGFLGTESQWLSSLKGVRGPRGAQGTSSEDSYPWGTEGTCYQKLQAALNSGYRMMYREDREAFEADTRCEVDQIRDERTIEHFRSSGLPVITDWDFVGIEGAWGGDEGGLSYVSDFKITIANEVSGSASLYGFCGSYGSDSALLIPLGNGEYLGSFFTHVGSQTLSTNLTIGFITRGGECYQFGPVLSQGLSVEVYEDPSTIHFRLQNHDDEVLQAAYAELYELWGW